PLLRDFGRKAAMASLERARIAMNIANINFRSRILAVVSDTENAYLNLVAARETLRIRQLTVDNNLRFFNEATSRRTSGVATDLDVQAADYQLGNARRGLLQAEQSVRDAEDRLMNLLNVPNFEVQIGPVAFDDYRGGAPN